MNMAARLSVMMHVSFASSLESVGLLTTNDANIALNHSFFLDDGGLDRTVN